MALTSRAFTMRPSPGQLTKAPHGRPAGLRGEAWGRSEKEQRGRVQTEIHPSFGNRREPAAAGTQGGRRELAGLGILGAFTQRQTTTLQQAVSRAGTPSSMRTPSTSSVRRPQHLCLLRHPLGPTAITWAGAIRGDTPRAFRVTFNFLVVTLKGVDTRGTDAND